jgi:hypothetical protein
MSVWPGKYSPVMIAEPYIGREKTPYNPVRTLKLQKIPQKGPNLENFRARS